MHILIIDNENARLNWFDNILEKANHEVRLADSSETALDQIREARFDLIFFNHDLGEDIIDGPKLIARIFRHSKRFKVPKIIWMHSSNPVGMQNILNKCESAGVLCHVKSYQDIIKNPENFLISIERLVEQVAELKRMKN